MRTPTSLFGRLNLIRKGEPHRKKILAKMVKQNNYLNYVEIGVGSGDTLLYIKKKNKNVRCIGFDPYKQDYKDVSDPCFKVNQAKFDRTFDRLKKNKRIELHRLPSEKGATLIDNNKVDMVFIDAKTNYDEVIKSIKAWYPKVRKGGIICGHDYCIENFGVVRAVNECFPNFVNVTFDTVWWYKK